MKSVPPPPEPPEPSAPMQPRPPPWHCTNCACLLTAVAPKANAKQAHYFPPPAHFLPPGQASCYPKQKEASGQPLKTAHLQHAKPHRRCTKGRHPPPSDFGEYGIWPPHSPQSNGCSGPDDRV